jgi:GNAT superfamily N-acetyltransferase
VSERPRDAPASVPRDVSPPTDEGRRCGDAVLSGLCRAGLVWPLDLSDPAAVARWQNADLASMVEGAFEERWLPEALVGAPRAYWRDRLSGAYRLPEPRDDEGLLTYLWLLEGGEAVGTMAVPALRWSPSDLAVWSLYVHPEARGAGVATRVLEAAYRLAVVRGASGDPPRDVLGVAAQPSVLPRPRLLERRVGPEPPPRLAPGAASLRDSYPRRRLLEMAIASPEVPRSRS